MTRPLTDVSMSDSQYIPHSVTQGILRHVLQIDLAELLGSFSALGRLLFPLLWLVLETSDLLESRKRGSD